jgi:ketosteroid isomerase-like protein
MMAIAQETEAGAAARRFVAAYNRGTADWVDECHAETTVWSELPLPGTPDGRGGDRAALRLAAEQAVAAFPNRRMQIRNLVAAGAQVALELDWHGTAALALPGVVIGERVHLRVAMFLTYAHGNIVAQVDYCVPISTV